MYSEDQDTKRLKPEDDEHADQAEDPSFEDQLQRALLLSRQDADVSADGGSDADDGDVGGSSGPATAHRSAEDTFHRKQFMDAVCCGTEKAMLRRLCEDARQDGIEDLVNLPCYEHFAEDGRTCATVCPAALNLQLPAVLFACFILLDFFSFFASYSASPLPPPSPLTKHHCSNFYLSAVFLCSLC
jgi:hypothetical protein